VYLWQGPARPESSVHSLIAPEPAGFVPPPSVMKPLGFSRLSKWREARVYRSLSWQRICLSLSPSGALLPFISHRDKNPYRSAFWRAGRVLLCHVHRMSGAALFRFCWVVVRRKKKVTQLRRVPELRVYVSPCCSGANRYPPPACWEMRSAIPSMCEKRTAPLVGDIDVTALLHKSVFFPSLMMPVRLVLLKLI